jgi:peptidoglycan hydrolase-like protein with peptidoglycan-binding domain
MKLRTAFLILVVPVGTLFADPKMESVQQALKDEGFYYGEITGNKDADTTAAIRRYQIRNGLQITGDLNDETLKALGVDSSGGRAIVKGSPTAAPDTSDLKVESEPREPQRQAESQGPTNPLTGQPFPEPRQDRQSSRREPSDMDGQAREGERDGSRAYQPQPPQNYDAIPRRPSGNFAGTPYESSSPGIQHDVILSAETILAGRGLYRGPIDGQFGSDLEFSLRAYQSRAHLPVTGRLDLDTLAALQLLPGANAPVYVPHRRAFQEPPVRGQWIHEP